MIRHVTFGYLIHDELLYCLLRHFNTRSCRVLPCFYVFSWHCVRGLISTATVNEPMNDMLFYLVTFLLIMRRFHVQ